MIGLVLKLLLAHIIGDFVLQPGQWIADKQQRKIRSPYLYWHLLVHIAVLMIVLQGKVGLYWKAFLIIPISHYFIDLFKIYAARDKNRQIMFFADQLAHLLVIAWVVYWYEPYTIRLSQWLSPPALLLLLALVCVTYVTSVVIRQLLTGWTFEEQQKEESLKNAGSYIGMLERLLVFCFIVINQWTAIAWLIAAKSIFRFSDLSRAKDRKLTEYILVGTLLSFGMAILTGLLYQYFRMRILTGMMATGNMTMPSSWLAIFLTPPLS